MEKVQEERAAGMAGLVHIDRIDHNHFIGQAGTSNGTASIFGGQILGQALAAAGQVVARRPHAMSGTFQRAGQVDRSIVYRVHGGRDGGRFANRQVVAEQDGQCIAEFSIGFHDEEDGFVHDSGWCRRPSTPERLPDLESAGARFEHVPRATQRALQRQPELDLRPVEPERLFDVAEGAARPLTYWLRARSDLSAMPSLWAPALAYMSDYLTAAAGLIHHARFLMPPDLFGTTLNHSLWLHRVVDPSRWLYCELESHCAVDGRTLNMGKIRDEHGRIVATLGQEALLRRRRPRPAAS